MAKKRQNTSQSIEKKPRKKTEKKSKRVREMRPRLGLTSSPDLE